MNFELTEERQMLQDTLRRFLSEATGDIWAGLAELGVLGAMFPEELGGFGGTGFDLAVVFEELGRADIALPMIDNALVPGWLLAAAGEDIEPLMAGAQRLAFAHAATAARYDLNWVETRAEGSLITGDKTLVMGANNADELIVSARHSGAPDDQAGIGLWRVSKDAKGLMFRSYALTQGGTAAELTLNKTPGIPLKAEAYEAISAANAAGTLAQTAETLGSMDTAIEMTREYLGTRKQFGRTIGSFQALAHRLVDLMVELEQARSAVILGAAHLSEPPQERDHALSATKNILGRAGRLVAEDVIQMHGGIGMTEEYAIGRLAKRIIMADHRFGDTDHHLEQFIALSRS